MPPSKAPRPLSLSGQLRGVIESRGLSPHRVAVSAKVTPSVMSRFMTGETGHLSLPIFEQVCVVLGLKVKLVPTGRGLDDETLGAPTAD